MKCPYCQIAGKTSFFLPFGRDFIVHDAEDEAVALSLEEAAKHVATYYDEEGRKHVHNECLIVLYAICSAGHNIAITTMESCPARDCHFGEVDRLPELRGTLDPDSTFRAFKGRLGALIAGRIFKDRPQ